MEQQTKSPHAGSAGASNVLGRNNEASSTSVEQRATTEFAHKAQLHTQAEAAMNLCIARTGDDSDAPVKSSAHGEAPLNIGVAV